MRRSCPSPPGPDEGLPELKRALLASRARGGIWPDREARGARLPIDRAFSIVGFGPVVTGSLVTGTISRDQKLELLPARRPVRVRRLEVHGRETEEARAGERVSANLAGVELADLRRGVVLAAPGAFATSALLTARLELLAGAPPVKSGDRVSFHHYSSEARAVVRVLDGRLLRGGETARVQLRLSRPVAAVPGDRFVVRRLSPVETIGGGVVLDPLVAAGAPRDAGGSRESSTGWTAASPRSSSRGSSRPGRTGPARKTLARRGPASAGEEVRAALAEPIARGPGARAAPFAGTLRRRKTPSRAWRSARARRSSRALREASGAVGVSRGTLLARLASLRRSALGRGASRRRSSRAGAYLVAGEEARAARAGKTSRAPSAISPSGSPTSSAAGASIRRRIADVTREVGHKQKVVEGLAAYLVKKGSLLRLPGGWLIAQRARRRRGRASARDRERTSSRRRRVQGDVRPDPPPRDPAPRIPGRHESDAPRRREEADRPERSALLGASRGSRRASSGSRALPRRAPRARDPRFAQR